jgi:hypothetical protein
VISWAEAGGAKSAAATIDPARTLDVFIQA